MLTVAEPDEPALPNRPERVLLVTDTDPENICGVLRKFHELQANLREQGCEVETIHTGEGEEDEFAGPFRKATTAMQATQTAV